MAEQRRTVCSRDCPDACTIQVTVEDGRAVRLAGDRDDPITQGFLCFRTSRFLGRQYAPDRILSPQVRRGDRWLPLDWSDALDLAAEKLLAIRAESGPAAILHYRSGGSLGLLKSYADALFEGFGPVTVKHGDICSGAGETAQEMDFGVSDSNDVFDLRSSRLIVLWGKNPHTSGVHLMPLLHEARKRGAVLVGLDPVRTKSAALCDVFLQPRPGADLAVAMGVARHLLDVGAVDPDAARYCDHWDEFQELPRRRSVAQWAALADLKPTDLLRFADLYAREFPATILVGWGMARRRYGAQTVRAVDALGAMRGNVGIPGGGVSYYFGRRSAFDASFVSGVDRAPRTLAEATLGQGIESAAEPPVRAVWVTAGNPVSMLPDSRRVQRALRSREFVVVVDTHPTDTTDCADLVLPTLTLLEDDDLFGAYGNHYLRASEPAIEPPAGPRHEFHIWQELAQRLGIPACLPPTIAAAKAQLLQNLAPHGIDAETLRQGAVRNPQAPPVLFAGRRFPTATGRVQLMTELPELEAPAAGGFPLRLLAASTPRAQSSQWSVEPDSRPGVWVHPRSAVGLADGEVGRLVSQSEALEVTVHHAPGVRPDVALMEKGGMLRRGTCANALIKAQETDFGHGAAYYDEPVRLQSLARTIHEGRSENESKTLLARTGDDPRRKRIGRYAEDEDRRNDEARRGLGPSQ